MGLAETKHMFYNKHSVKIPVHQVDEAPAPQPYNFRRIWSGLGYLYSGSYKMLVQWLKPVQFFIALIVGAMTLLAGLLYALIYTLYWLMAKLVALSAAFYGVYMAVRSKSRRNKTNRSVQQSAFQRYFPAFTLLAIALVILAPNLLALAVDVTGQVIEAVPRLLEDVFGQRASIAPIFTEEVSYWSEDIQRWSDTYDIDPNLLATVMQIESCGHPTVSSSAGAQGLFQVMPYHFAADENMLDPETNIKRGAEVLQQCLQTAEGDIGLALACYNGGPSVTTLPFNAWYPETQRYYQWGTGIYTDATSGNTYSITLYQWLEAGGQSLCDRASSALGLN